MAKEKAQAIPTEESTTPSQDRRAARRTARQERRRAEANGQTDVAPPRWRLPLLALAITLTAATIYWLRLDRMAGQFLDDAWYLLLAKALATGQGYQLINAPTPGVVPLYPPGFPVVLSLAWRLAPQFPANLWLLKLVSILAMFAAGVVTFHYARRWRGLPDWAALGLAAATTLAPGFVFLATASVMSECVFTLLQLLAIVALEHCAHAEPPQAWRFAVLGAALASFTFLTRSMAVALLLAGFIYLWKEGKRQAALIFAAGVLVCVMPWMLYTRSHPLTAAQRAEQNNSYMVRGYAEQFWDRLAGHTTSGQISASDLPARVGNNVLEAISQGVGGTMATPLFPGLNQGLGERMNALRWLAALLLTALVIAGFITVVRRRVTLAELVVPLSLGVILLWPFPPYRYVLPFLPFLLFYLAQGVRALQGLHQRGMALAEAGTAGWTLAGVLLWLIVAAHLYTNFEYIGRQYADLPRERPRWMRIFEENEVLLEWAGKQLTNDGVIAAQNPALAHLYTNRKTLTLDAPAQNWELWKQLNVRYLMHTSPVAVAESPAERDFSVIYRSRGDLNLKIVDLGAPANRPAWNESNTQMR